MKNKFPKIVFFSESHFSGKIKRTFKNMRTEYAGYTALNAKHRHIQTVVKEEYDIGIFIIPKDFESFQFESNKKKCKYVGIMQEGPSSYGEDYSIKKQLSYYQYLNKVDFILCHNEIDKKYYEGLLLESKPVFIMPTLMIEDALRGMNLNPEREDKTIIGGNLCRGYGGFPSYIIASRFNNDIYVPQMGRMKEREKSINNLNHLPYMQGNRWMETLGTFKYAVHLMKTCAAATFALNCAYGGIPCIGYNKSDTQRKCHPDLSVEPGDVKEAIYLAELLKNDEVFYKDCSKNAKWKYNNYYKEDKYKNHMKEVFKKIMDI